MGPVEALKFAMIKEIEAAERQHADLEATLAGQTGKTLAGRLPPETTDADIKAAIDSL